MRFGDGLPQGIKLTDEKVSSCTTRAIMFTKTGAVAWTFNGLAAICLLYPANSLLERTDATIAQDFASSLSNGSLDESATEAAKA